jgi:hypothetical protein
VGVPAVGGQFRPVNRYIEVPVDKVVERIIEVPKPVDRSGPDNPPD